MTHPNPINRRDFLKLASLTSAGAAAAALPGLLTACTSVLGAQNANPVTLNVLTPAPPDPAPPGVAKFSLAALDEWKLTNNAQIDYEALPWDKLHHRMAGNFASGRYADDLVYMSGWVPEFASDLLPFVDKLPQELLDDLPASSFNTVTWDGKRLGVIFTLSLLTLFYNTKMFADAGLDGQPANWDDLKRYARELTHGGQYGWVLNYGVPEGIGGTASYWFCFLQQAGGKLYDENGQPAFNNEQGVDALQVMVDLMPYTDPKSLIFRGINDATNAFTEGQAAMMMNWPFTWKPASDPETSKIVGQLGSAVLPAGPAGTASIDGSDAWTIAANTIDKDLSQKLVEFYLDKEVQKRQVLDTGWLPIRLSVLQDPEVQKAAQNAAVVLQQAQAPYDSFITPDYDAVTTAIGVEIQNALTGQQTAAQAIQNASDQVAQIVQQRGN